MYDFIIVGAGSAGCVLANRLSADPSNRVLLLEAGPPDRKLEIHIPAAWIRTLKTEVDWNYATEPQTHLHDRRLYWPRGKTLGGSSAINAMIYMRGNRHDYDQWAALGNAGWGYEDVLPYFKKMENQERGASAYHGVGGPLNVADLRDPNPLTMAFLAAGNALGLNYRTDFNGETQEGVGLFQVTQKDGKRHSAADAYLKPIKGRENLVVRTGVLVTRVLFNGKRAVGVAYSEDGLPREAYTGGEVLLCGGSINSPQLLMLSGIGAASHLERFDINVIADLPGVGQNLQDHLIAGVINYSVRPVSLASATQPINLLPFFLAGRGLLTSNVAEAGAFMHTQPGLPVPDVQFHFGPAHFVDHGQTPIDGHGFALGGLVLRPKSRGFIQLRSDHPLTYPVIQPNYLEHEDDLPPLVDCIRWARRVFQAEPFDTYRGLELLPGHHVETDEQIREYIREKAETLYHPVGTCKMGGDPLAVVDDQLRVHTLEGLRVVDASIMPTIVSGNTNAPTMMIAEKAANLILNA